MFETIWKWRSLIIFGALGLWVWRESVESDKRRAVEEAQIQADAAAKVEREEILRKSYEATQSSRLCNITFDVLLKTFGKNVMVELRVGEVGNSFPLEVRPASDGRISFAGLCPATYFLAIGDDKQVSTTAPEPFEADQGYTSTIELTSGPGNVGSSRRERL